MVGKQTASQALKDHYGPPSIYQTRSWTFYSMTASQGPKKEGDHYGPLTVSSIISVFYQGSFVV